MPPWLAAKQCSTASSDPAPPDLVTGHGISIVRTTLTTVDSNVVHHNKRTGILFGSANECRYEADGAPDAPLAIAIRNVTAYGNGDSNACLETKHFGFLETRVGSLARCLLIMSHSRFS